MCYAIPAKLIAINGQIGTVDYFGEHRQVLLDLDDLHIGDYIYAQGGVSVRKIAEQPNVFQHYPVEYNNIFPNNPQPPLALPYNNNDKQDEKNQNQ